jgi:GNAT superfamily N-acetyltransferase
VTRPAIALATPADTARLIDTIVTAFAADPAFRYFFPEEETYQRYASSFARQLVERRIALGTAWLAEEGAAVALWDPPAPPPPSTMDLPDEVIARLDAYDGAVHDLRPTVPHWYLGILATHPDAAGRGWGRAVMAAGVQRARDEGLPAYLETSNPVNVEIYRGAGWEIAGTSAADGLPIWVLVNSGAAARTPQ